jgi:protein subunit release factor B
LHRYRLTLFCQFNAGLYSRRKNYFIGAQVFETDALTATDCAGPLSLLDKDILYETLRGSGPGSQQVNKGLAHTVLAHKLATLDTGVTTSAGQQRWQQRHRVERDNSV